MKKACVIVGFLALLLIWAGPLLSAWRGSFAAHMLAHMGVVAIAAPLIAIGISDKMPSARSSIPLLTAVAPAAMWARDAAGGLALVLTSIHMTLLGALLSLASRPLYGVGDVTCFGLVLEAGQDQALGGVVMLMIGAVVYLAGGVFLLSRLLSDRRERLAG